MMQHSCHSQRTLRLHSAAAQSSCSYEEHPYQPGLRLGFCLSSFCSRRSADHDGMSFSQYIRQAIRICARACLPPESCQVGIKSSPVVIDVGHT